MKYAIDNDIIDLSYVQEKIEMNKRKSYLSKHNFKIWEGSDKKWRTYLPDKNGRKMLKRNTKKDIEDAIIDYYKKIETKEAENQMTFEEVYWHWRDVQDNMISPNSITKYNGDYKRYFKNSDFINMYIDKITEEDIKIFIVKSIKEKKLCKKACKTLFGYIKNTIKSAKINKVIRDDPMEFLEAKQFYKYCFENPKPIEKRIISDSDMEKLYEKFLEDYVKQPSYITTYAVHFASLTGMRVGEISALTWDCITDTYIIINKSEKYNRMTKEYYVDKTKNGKDRIFPLTEEIKKLLWMIKKAEMKNGYMCEWVFANGSGRIHAPAISSCCKNKCRQLGIDEKGIHAFRRTINSKMRCSGVSATVAASLLGHTTEVNEQYYTFDISNIQEKEKIISSINKKII